MSAVKSCACATFFLSRTRCPRQDEGSFYIHSIQYVQALHGSYTATMLLIKCSFLVPTAKRGLSSHWLSETHRYWWWIESVSVQCVSLWMCSGRLWGITLSTLIVVLGKTLSRHCIVCVCRNDISTVVQRHGGPEAPTIIDVITGHHNLSATSALTWFFRS